MGTNHVQFFYSHPKKAALECEISLTTVKLIKNVASNLTDLNNFHPLEAGDRVSEPQLQVKISTENLNDQRVD